MFDSLINSDNTHNEGAIMPNTSNVHQHLDAAIREEPFQVSQRQVDTLPWTLLLKSNAPKLRQRPSISQTQSARSTDFA